MSDANISQLLLGHFAGRVVRKDLTKLIRQGANVPVYVLEYLLGMYCASDDEQVIAEGLANVKRILAENYVRPDEAEKVKSKIRELGSYKVIDKVTVKLNTKKDVYEASLSNLGVGQVEIGTHYVKDYEKLLAGGIWCMIELRYLFEEKANRSPFVIADLKPIQMPNMDIKEIFEGRRAFSKEQWVDVLMRSIGMEPANLKARTKWLLLNRLIPLVENNYNCCELGPRSTGKSHVYKEISPSSILVSGGQTSVANLFYNMGSKTVGLVGLWDVVAFDEIANVGSVNETVDLMKDYMASGSFSRGKDSIQAYASMVFIGNLNDSVDTLVKTSHLFAPFPEKMIDSAFFDRFHAYIPGWEVPKFRPSSFTDDYGFIVDYLAEYFREMRKRSYADAIDKYFKLGKDLNQRDVIAVRRTVSGLVKLMYPNGEYTKADIRECLEYAMETRRRVKEQLKKIGGIEFYDVHFSYIDNETMEESFVAVPEQGGNKLIPEGPMNPGHLHIIAPASSGKQALYRLELQVLPGTGKLALSGFGSNTKVKESLRVAFDSFKANATTVSAGLKVNQSDYHMHLVDYYNAGPSEAFALAGFVSLCSGALGKALQGQLVLLGNMSLGGNVEQARSLAESLQIAFDNGGKRLLMPMSSVSDIPSVPGELFARFQVSFYADPVDAAFKALGAT
jgi:ATP-dependent Lon protease